MTSVMLTNTSRLWKATMTLHGIIFQNATVFYFHCCNNVKCHTNKVQKSDSYISHFSKYEETKNEN